MQRQGGSSTAGDGIVAEEVEITITIRNVGRLVCLGMTEIDRKIIKMMLADHTYSC